MDFKNKSVLVTGMSGSLGTALSKYFLNNQPKRLVCFSRCWQKQERLRKELGSPPYMRWLIGDVRDEKRLKRAMNNIDIVIHAAAIKDVVSAEFDSFEAVQTNVIGTENVINASIDAGVDKVLVISSDKSAQSANTYGKTKALAESLAVASNTYTRQEGTDISACRYGNVIGSSGSVVPIFQKQAKTGTLTITDTRMNRFWIKMDDAVKFIINCIDVLQGGEIFVPRLKSAYILDLAKAIAPDAEIEEIGSRPGEKLAEVMITAEESSHTKQVKDYYVIEPENPLWDYKPIDSDLVPRDWCYSSDANTDWLSVDEIRDLIPADKVCACKR